MSRRLQGILLAAALAAATLTPAGAARAVLPDEVLDDPVLEGRARELSKVIRCVVCQNESIDSSNADLARDLRLLVRERLVAGDSDEAVLDFLVARYGEFVLLRPRVRPGTYFLWYGPAAMLLLGGFGVVLYFRHRRREGAPGPADLSSEERARLSRLLSEERDAD